MDQDDFIRSIFNSNNYSKVGRNSCKYPIITCTIYILVAASMISLYIVFTNMFTEYLDPPFKIEIETTNSSSQTALDRPFKKIYTFITSDGSEEVFAPSFKMNVKHWKADTGIALAVFFLVLVTQFIVGSALYGILKEERVFLLPLHIYVYVISGMILFLLFSFLRSVSIKEAEMNPPSFNSTVIERKEYITDRCTWVWVGVLMLTSMATIFDAWFIGSELNKMETINKNNRRIAVHQATSNL